MIITGEKVVLKPMTIDNIDDFFRWAINEPFWYGTYGDPVPTFEGFIQEYPIYYFDGSRPENGRCFLILLDSEVIGEVNYNEIDSETGFTDLDILILEPFRGKGYGPDALKAFTDYLFDKMAVNKCIIEPIVLNERAVKAYEKAGFKLLKTVSGDGFDIAHMEMVKP